MRAKGHIRDLEVADVDVGGDIHRIILGGIVNPGEANARASREALFRDYDALRRLLISYPYGTDDMCADLVFDSDHAEAAHGYVIMESMGYPYYSGSNTIATVAALLEYGRVPFTEGVSEISLDSPGGVVRARYRIEGDRILEVTVNGGAAYVIEDGCTVTVPGIGPVGFALVWSGAYYVMVDAEAAGVTVDAAGLPAMKRAGRAITRAIEDGFDYHHQDYGRIESPGFVHFMGTWEQLGRGDAGEPRYHGVGATYGTPATVYRCPTGTGTSARMALMAHRGRFEPDATMESVSAMGNRFVGRALGTETAGAYEALGTTITARPFVLATTRMHLDFDNPRMATFRDLRSILA